MKVEHLQARQLTPHPLLGREGMLPDMIEREIKLGNRAGSNRQDHKDRAVELIQEFEATKRDILLRGIIEPLQVTKTLAGYNIADGRNRWAGFQEITALRYDDPAMQAAASKLEKEGLPCVVIEEEQVPAAILSAMTRRHMTKQARALMAVKTFPKVAENTASGRKSLAHQGISQPELAERIGVSLSIMEEACRFWREIALKPKTREERMNQVFAGMSFSRVLQGDAAAEKSKGKPREETKPALLLLRSANSMSLHWSKWDDISVDARLSVKEHMVSAMLEAPEEIREAVQAAWEGGNS